MNQKMSVMLSLRSISIAPLDETIEMLRKLSMTDAAYYFLIGTQ
jgi:hypothetical protein